MLSQQASATSQKVAKTSHLRGVATAAAQCTICPQTLINRASMFRHLRRVHKVTIVGDGVRQKTLKCSECQDTYNSFREITQHYKDKHDINITEETMEFSCRGGYELWKEATEESTASKFVNRGGGKKVREKIILEYLQCHRNGVYKPSGKNLRALKKSGSNKLETFCPARMVVKSKKDQKDEQITVTYFPKHLGHSCDPSRVPLSVKEKNQLAAQMLQGVPMDQVLENVAEKANPSKRLAIIRKKDLHNIAASYNIYSENVVETKDAASVDAWVVESQSQDGNPILLYKPQGVMSEECKNLDAEMFFLAYMNKAQQVMFQKFGNNVISINSTRETNKYGIALTTIIVLDENYESFPVAFLYCDQATEMVYRLFFAKIKERLQIHVVTPKIFMSDDSQAFYDAWEAEFGTANHCLLCNWHVQQTWGEHLQSISRRGKKDATMGRLKSMQQERDLNTFKKLLSENVSFFLNDESTAKFGKYFQENYADRPQLWASCYRVGAKINYDVAIQRWHKDLNYNLGQHKTQHKTRLNKTIGILMKCLQKKTIGRVIPKSRLKLPRKLMEIQERHNWCDESDACCEEEEEGVRWLVTSESTNESYEVTKILNSCNCNLICDACAVCLHQYMCSCVDSRVKYNMCQHIHRVCRVFNDVAESVEAGDDNNISDLFVDDTDARESMNNNDTETVYMEVQNNESVQLLNTLKAEARAEVKALLEELENYTTEDQLRQCAATIHKCRKTNTVAHASKKPSVVSFAIPMIQNEQEEFEQIATVLLTLQDDHCYSVKEIAK